MNDKPETKIDYVSPLKRICMTIGELPTSYLETMSYYEMLIWFTKFLQEKVIPTIDNNAQAVEELQHLFIELQSYVNNYFDNLDVQEEINNKLDEMLEDGVLEQIIEQFLQLTSLICFDNVADMKLSQNLTNGSYARTLGYYEKNDGGESLYKIRSITTNDVIDECSIIRINDVLIAELIIINNIINIKQFGAKGDNETDDTVAIQKAINYYHVGNDSNNQNYATVLIANYPNAGGTIYFPKGTYCISSTLKIPCYVDLDLGYSTIKAITGGTFTNNYMISVNSFDVETWTYAYVPRIGFIRNGIISGNNIENIKGIFITDPHKIENIEFYSLYNSINYPNTVYVDMIYINSIQVRNPKGTEYQIIKKSQGENTSIKNVHFPVNAEEEENPTAGINITNGHSGKIENIINGKIYFYNTEDYTLSKWHCENGYFYGGSLNNTIIRDSNIYIRNEQTPITLNGETVNNNNRVSYLENVNFIYYLQNEEFNYDTHNIDITNYYQQLFIKGCYRYLWTKSINSISATGITIYNGTKDLLNPYDDVEIYAKAIIPQNSSARRDDYIFLSVVTNSYVNWNKETGTYYYKMINLADVERLCGKITDERSINISSATNGAKLNINGNLGKGNTIRIYRGTSSATYTEFVDIPSPKNMALYDNGYSINGYKWKTVNESNPVITSVNAIATVERVYNFTNTLARCKGYGSPSVGTWITGDIIEKVNPTAGGNLGYVCTSGGTYGTWKTYGNISE